MKLKDVKGALRGTKIRISDKKDLPSNEMFIYSAWNKGLWLKKNLKDERIYPYFFEDFKEIEDFEVKDKVIRDE